MLIRHAVFITFLMITIIVMTVRFSYSSDSNQPLLGNGYSTSLPAEPHVQIPDSLTLKYKPDVSKRFKPFLGTGLAYSVTTQETHNESKKEMKAGVGAKAGFNFQLGKNFSINFDYNYLYLSPDVRHALDGSTPQQIGIGINLMF